MGWPLQDTHTAPAPVQLVARAFLSMLYSFDEALVGKGLLGTSAKVSFMVNLGVLSSGPTVLMKGCVQVSRTRDPAQMSRLPVSLS